jgi:GNAT superfamily N-acetyltransferase
LTEGLHRHRKGSIRLTARKREKVAGKFWRTQNGIISMTNDFLENSCNFDPLLETTAIFDTFDCGDDELNDFFRNDALPYQKELLGKTYYFSLKDDPSVIVCAFTVANDSIKTFNIPGLRKNKINRTIPNVKRRKNYPAVLIGRLGVNAAFKNKNIGSEAVGFIKLWFTEPNNKTGCRFVLVDAYNNEIPLSFYKKNGFAEMFPSEDEERTFREITGTEKLDTRLLYFDLIELSKGK